ncbi:MAG: AsmA-like C-terminal region-containing protein [Bacteroidota bacterium]
MKNNKLLRKVLKGLGIALMVIIVLAIILPFVFRKQIVEAVKTEINKSVNAKVDFTDYHLTLFRNFPDFTLGLDHVTVVGVDEFAKDTLANIQSLKVTIGLFSVISGSQYNIKKISIDQPKILLKVLKGGKANWDIAKQTAADTAKAAPAAEPSSFKLSLKKLTITNASIKYDDADAGMYADIKNLNHLLKGDLTADFTSLSTETTIDTIDFSYGGIQYLHKGNISLTADIDADLKNSKYTFKENELRLNNLFLGFDGWVAMPADDIDMDIKFSARKTEFKNFLSLIPAVYSKDFEKVKTGGTLALDGFAKGTYNDKSLPAFALNVLVQNAMFQYPDLPKAVTNINVDVHISNKDGKPNSTLIDIKKAHFEMAGNTADIRMSVATPVSDPAIDGTVKVKIDLAQVKQFYPLDASEQLNGKVDADVSMKGRLSSIEKEKYNEFQAKGQIGVTGMNYKSKDYPQGIMVSELKLLFSPQFVDMPACNIKMGRSDISANGRLDNLLFYIFKNDKLKGTFNSRSNVVDLNEFTGGSSSATATPAATTPQQSSAMTVIEVPANLDIVLKSSFGKIIYDKMELSNVLGIVKIQDRKVTLENLKMDLLGGNMAVSGFYSTQKTQPQVNFNLDIKGFDIPKTYKTFVTVQKLAPIMERCTGKFSTTMSFITDLDGAMSPVYNTMSGNGKLSANNVSVQGFEPLNKVAEVLKIEKFRKIGFDKTEISFSFANGKLEVKPYTFTFEKIKATASGFSSLDQSINYLVNLEIPRELFGGQANGVLNDLVGKANSKGANLTPGNTIFVDLVIGGTVTKPTVKAGVKGSAKEVLEDLKKEAEKQITDKVKEEVGKVKADVQAKIDKLLADANAKAQQIRDQAKAAGDKLVAEADAQGQDLVKKASNPIAKAAAKETAKQMLKEAKDKSQALQDEGNRNAQKVLDDAQKEADKLRNS